MKYKFSIPYIAIVLFCLLATISCVSDTKKKPVEVKEPNYEGNFADPNEVLSDNQEAVGVLYDYYTPNPTTQRQIDENKIIDYIMKLEIPFKRTESGLYYHITKEGKGPNYMTGQPAKANYRGYFLNGSIFDSSYSRNRPISFKAGMMVKGWNEAMSMMNPGTNAMLLLPSHLAYGEKGFANYVGPNEVLGFDIELLSLATATE